MNRKKSKYYVGTPMLKAKLLWIWSVRKNTQCPILLCFVVYTPTQYALSCKIPKFVRKNIQCPILLCVEVYTKTQYVLSSKIPKFELYGNRQKSKYYLGTPKLKENGSEYNLSEKIYNALFYSVLEYIHQFSMLSHVKHSN